MNYKLKHNKNFLYISSKNAYKFRFNINQIEINEIQQGSVSY